jgi:hypothetical protein
MGALAEDAYSGVLRSLSADGAAKLREHLDYVKTRIQIFPLPDMSAGLH